MKHTDDTVRLVETIRADGSSVVKDREGNVVWQTPRGTYSFVDGYGLDWVTREMDMTPLEVAFALKE
jgi:hypothetical protein